MTTVLPIAVSRGRRRPLRLAATLLIVLAGHAVLLVILGLDQPNIRWLLQRSLIAEPVQVLLWPKARQAQTARGGGRGPRSDRKRTAPASPIVEAIPAPQGPPAQAAGSGSGAASGEQEGLGWPTFGPNLARRIRPTIGCAHPEAYRLSKREQERCDDELGEQGRHARFLGLMIPPEKAAAYERTLHCRRIYDDNNTPTGNQTSNAPGGITGLGYVPSLRECPPGEH